MNHSFQQEDRNQESEVRIRWAPAGSAVLFVFFLCAASPLLAQTGFPFQDESLRYSINWPSGLSLGEASFSARHTAAGWSFDSTLSAGIPGFSISDKYQ